jgi:hypothetical protein
VLTKEASKQLVMSANVSTCKLVLRSDTSEKQTRLTWVLSHLSSQLSVEDYEGFVVLGP